MRYYGIKDKIRKEKFLYNYANACAKLKSIIPGKQGEFNKNKYTYIFNRKSPFSIYDNSLPKDCFLKLDEIVTSDLIYREDIEKLQKGIRFLLRKYKAGSRFFPFHTDSFEETCAKIDKMDSTLTTWYNGIRCGVFEFHNEKLKTDIDYFSLNIKNINSSFLSLEFHITITESKRKELDKLIAADYHNTRGYIRKSLCSRKDGGAIDTYSVIYHSDDGLKADKIYEWISSVEWEFYEELKKFFPLILHGRNIMPPRLELYYTNIDYHIDNRHFWESVGISSLMGQFIDEQQKMFFETYHSSRYDQEEMQARLMYIVKDDGIAAGQFKSVKDRVYFHTDEYAVDYFRFLFLSILSRVVGEEIVCYKHRLDKIKLKENKLNKLLKLRYNFECTVDLYVRYVRDNDWEKSNNKLENDIYSDNNELLKYSKGFFGRTCKGFARAAVAECKKIDGAIRVLRTDFEDKEKILQHLTDYKNSEKNWRLNFATFLVTAATLFFIIFPDKTLLISTQIMYFWDLIAGLQGIFCK